MAHKDAIRDRKVTAAQKQLLELINDPKVGAVIGRTLGEIAVELMDAKVEANHWKKAFETVRAEMKQLAAIVLMDKPDKRLVVTEGQLRKVPPGLELHFEAPETGVRIYQLRPRAEGVEAGQQLQADLDKAASIILN